MSETLPVDAVVVGERDREDLRDLRDLMASVEAVGLLHPVVVTARGELVAGGRRLEALRRLGWTSVPVTVIAADNAETLLRAETDENDCRVALTPYEASRARERRARLLAPIAAERKRSGKAASSANFAGGPARDVRAAAAVGTGYSHATLDKVDEIRDVAERGVVRRSSGEVPAPTSAVKVARKALADVKVSGAAVEPSVKAVRAALEDVLGADPDVNRARARRAFFAALGKVQPVTRFAPTDAAALLTASELEHLNGVAAHFARWVADVNQQQPARLRAVHGGKNA